MFLALFVLASERDHYCKGPEGTIWRTCTKFIFSCCIFDKGLSALLQRCGRNGLAHGAVRVLGGPGHDSAWPVHRLTHHALEAQYSTSTQSHSNYKTIGNRLQYYFTPSFDEIIKILSFSLGFWLAVINYPTASFFNLVKYFYIGIFNRVLHKAFETFRDNLRHGRICWIDIIKYSHQHSDAVRSKESMMIAKLDA